MKKKSSAASKMSLHEEKEEGRTQTVTSPEPSQVSMRSERSLTQPPNLSDGAVTSDPRQNNVQAALQEETGDLQKSLTDELQRVKDQHKTSMKNKYERLFEGLKLQENESLLNSIYTQLYIIEGEREGVNKEHEVLQMEKTARTQHSQDTPIDCNDIFKASAEAGCEEKEQIKTVLTKGIAGIGKTVSVQKFILDWAEGKANQDVDFMFVLPFRELNLIRDQYSLHRLLLDFHPELQDLDSQIYEECKVVFIFDGLDESRITLMFSDAQKVCDVTETSSVAVLMSKLMKGELLPSALIWITTRPAAANQIPSKYIHRLTEIQGFTEPQKEEYFRKRISDEHQASRIISHIRRARSLHIMCHIPVFCWISSTVLQKLLEEDLSAEIPQTLTEMYIHFLLIQINMRKQKYEERDPEKLLQSNREVIVKLAEVAFKQLMKGNVMFYEEDLIESGIDVTDASVYSGICTEIFKQESVIHQRKVYSFIHLSVQEFLAAFHVFYCYLSSTNETLKVFDSLHNLLRGAVDKALKSKNGHLDLFLRFLLGVSLESNQRLLQDLLTHTENSSESIRETTQYIKEKIKDGRELSIERSINLFLCLLEVKDQTLFREIQEFVKSDKHSEKKLSPSHCSAIAYMLQMSEEPLDELDLMKYNTSDEGRRRLIPAVINCQLQILSLAGCNLIAQCCERLSSALQSSNCVLRELDLSNNHLQDSGVKFISDGLKSPNCQLQILSLAGCNLIAQCCERLSSALQSSNCVLRELDLSNNHLQDSGVKFISDGLKSPNCQLQILRLSGCMVTEEGCGYLSSALSSNPSHLRELDLSYNHPGQSGVQLLNHKQQDPNYKLQILNLDHGGPFRIKPGLRKYACDLTLDPNTANTQLILSEKNRKISYVEDHQPYPDHPERFADIPQVLCRETLTGRCYWEVEWGTWARIAVTYKGISRKEGTVCKFGYNDKSWCLNCSLNGTAVWHNNVFTIVTHSPPSTRVGIYLDWPAGTLSFYRVSDTHTLTHLHTFKTIFTEPLYAGFKVFESELSLCQI
uniref:NACHT, LRR and PYD domains-containing protein 12-like n=1 Tax=Cyprinus carpio TaxID=7962 RepID=A0A8C2DJN9_CYPCA